MRFPSLRRHSRFARDLDAYVDGELAHARVIELELHLARCTSCTRIVEESQLLKRMAATLPEVTAPRSFRLSPEMLASPLPGAHPHSNAQGRASLGRFALGQPWQLNLARGAAAIAIFAFIATVTVDLAGGGGSSSTAGVSPSSSLESAADSAGAKSFTTGSTAAAGGAQAAAPQPIVPSAAVGSPATGPTQAAQRSSLSPAVGIGPPGSATAAAVAAHSGAASDSARPPYRAFEGGLAGAAVTLAAVVLYLTRRRRNLL